MTQTAATIQALITSEVGDSVAGVSAIQTVTITGAPTGGTFTLTYAGQTTSALAYNATATTIQAALQALTTINAGNATAAGADGGPWTITFTGALANLPAALLTGNGAGLTGGTSPSVVVANIQSGAAGGGILAANMANIWDSYADKALVAPRLQELYSKRRAIDLVLGYLRNSVDYTTDVGFSIRAHQRIDTLEAMRKSTEADIALVEKQALTVRVPVAGALSTIEPIAPPAPGTPPSTFPPDASAPSYSGSPYFRPRWRP